MDKAQRDDIRQRMNSSRPEDDDALSEVNIMQLLDALDTSESRVAWLEVDRSQCLAEMRSCELDVQSPLEGFLASTNALQAEISVCNEFRARVAELEVDRERMREKFAKIAKLTDQSGKCGSDGTS